LSKNVSCSGKQSLRRLSRKRPIAGFKIMTPNVRNRPDCVEEVDDRSEVLGRSR
jgi:hypothetical protein